MTIATRGVSKHWIARDKHIEQVCDCACHDHSGVFHFAPCCYEPKTMTGQFLLNAFNTREFRMNDDIEHLLAEIEELEKDMLEHLSPEEQGTPLLSDENGNAVSPREWVAALKKDASEKKEGSSQ